MQLHCLAGSVDEQVASRIIAAASDLALVVDREGVIRNVALGEAVPASPGWNKLVGKRWVETIALDSQSKVELLLQEARAGGVPRAREINQQAEGVGDAIFRFSAVLLKGEQQVVALGRDLSALSALQQQMIKSQQAMDREYGRLRQAETRYRLLFQVTAEGVMVVQTASLKVLECNPAAGSLLQESAPAVQGRTLPDLIEASSWPALQAKLAVAEAGGRPSAVPVRLRPTGGEVMVAISLFRQAGMPLLLLRLLPTTGAPLVAGSRESRLLAVLEALPDSMVIIGEDQRILCANTAFTDLVQQGSENHVVGQPLDRWLGRPGVDLNIMLANLREHGSVRSFATIVRSEFGPPQEAMVSAVAALDAKVPCLGFLIRTIPAQLAAGPAAVQTPRSVDQLRELVGRVPLKEIVRDAADLIEQLCIKAALQVSGDNRASAAQLLGLSRQGLYSKLRRYGLGDLDPNELD